MSRNRERDLNFQNKQSLKEDDINKKIYTFTPIKKPVLTKYVIREIIKLTSKSNTMASKFKISLDLGLSTSDIEVVDDTVIFSCGECVDLSVLKSSIDDMGDDDIFVVIHGNIRKVALSANGNYYKLKAVGPYTAPTLEINGIHMHRITGITPWEDSLLKVKCARVRRGMKVLDICTGLGYTAIASLLRGAFRVITIEIDEHVLEIASYNPWSWRLADERINIILGDATEVIEDIKDSSIDRIIHDPPTLALAGELYSKEFYKELFRVLKRGGVLFHYTGKPGYMRGVNVTRGVVNRLRHVGFQVKIVREAYGVVAFKPRSG